MFKKLAFGALVTGAALALVFGSVRAYVGARFSSDSLREEIESRYSCRAEVEAVELTLFHRSPRLVAHRVSILPQGGDGSARELTGLRVGEIELNAEFWPLLKGELEVTSIVLRQPVANTVVSKDGESSLNLLFDKRPDPGAPSTAATGRLVRVVDPVFVTTAPAARQRAERGREADTDNDEPGGFHASSLSLPRSLRRARIEGGQINAYLERPKAYLRMLGLTAEVSEIDFDPDDLANHNRAVLGLEARLAVDGADGTTRYTDLALAMQGAVTPFDATNGYLNPDQVYPLVLGQGSSIEALPMLDQLSGSLQSLERAGLRLDRLKLRAELREDAPFNLALGGRRVELVSDAVLPFTDYTLTLRQGSWVRGADSSHAFSGNLLASEAMSLEAVDSLEDMVSQQVGNLAGESLGESVAALAREVLVEPMLVEGKISLDFRTVGKLSSPKVKVDNKLRDLKDAAKEALRRGAVGDLLKGLLGK